MYGMGAVADEDKLDADETKKVLRRTARMAQPFRKTVAAALCVHRAVDARRRCSAQ